MSAIPNSDVFFFISSIGFIFLWVMGIIFLFYLIRATKSFSRIMKNIEDDIENIGDTTKEMLEDLHQSALFNFFFRRHKKHRSK